MPLVPKVVVHIGLHKTGTTSIQQNFVRISKDLEKSGVIYPSFIANHSIPLVSVFSDDPAAYFWNRLAGITTAVEIAKRNEEFIRRFNADLCKPAELAIFSGEDLSLLSEAGVQRFSDWLSRYALKATIVAYVRETTAWATSQAQELVKSGQTLGDVLNRSLAPRFRERLSPWMAVFGKSNIRVYDFDDAKQHEAGLAGHFAQAIGLTAPVLPMIRDMRSNESLSAEAVSLLSKLNELRPTLRDCGPSPERMQHDVALFARVKGSRFKLSDAAIERARRDSEPEVVWLDREFGIRFAEPPPDTPSQKGLSLFASEEFRISLVTLVWDLAIQAEKRVST